MKCTGTEPAPLSAGDDDHASQLFFHRCDQIRSRMFRYGSQRYTYMGIPRWLSVMIKFVPFQAPENTFLNAGTSYLPTMGLIETR